jgi:hypothetical protein
MCVAICVVGGEPAHASLDLSFPPVSAAAGVAGRCASREHRHVACVGEPGMASIAGLNNFNNLLYATKKWALYDAL